MEKKEKGPSPFDFVKTILNGLPVIPMNKGYSNHIVNRAVAHHRDVIHVAQMLNEVPGVTSEQHYSFLYHSVPKNRRGFEPWVKDKKDDEMMGLELVAKYYECSLEVAREYMNLLSTDDLKAIRASYGGKD